MRILLLIFSLLVLSPIYLIGAAVAVDGVSLTPDEKRWLERHPGPLRVHNEQDWRPYNFNEDGVPKGYSIDYMNLVAEKLGLTVEYVSGPTWDDFLGMMKAGMLDVMINIASTRDRRKYLRFTEPYMIMTAALFVRRTEHRIQDLSDMAGRRIGFIKGFFFGEFIRKYYPEIEIREYDSALETFLAIDKGEVDATIDLPVVAQRTLSEANITSLKIGGEVTDPRFISTFSIGTRLDQPALLDILQKGMDAISPEEELRIRQKWDLEEKELPLVSESEIAYLQDQGTLTACLEGDRLPLQAMGIDGKPTGMASEFLRLIERRTKTAFAVSTRPAPSRDGENGKVPVCDILPMAEPSRALYESFDLSAPWLTLDHVVVTRRNQIYISSVEQIVGRKIGVVRNAAVKDSLRAVYPDMDIVEAENVVEGIHMVERGEVFGFIDTVPTVSRVLQGQDVADVKISGNIGFKASYGVGVRNDDPRLLSVMNRVVASIEREEIGNIHQRWLAVTYVDRVDMTRVWLVVAGALLIVVYFVVRHRRNQKVTLELRAAHAQAEAALHDLDLKNQELDKMARTDRLTGLFNRHEIDEVLVREWTRFERYGNPFSLVMMDIDYFKVINDSHGHAVGDQVLQVVATAMRTHTRESDVVGRWGGEEFLVVCPFTEENGARQLAEALRGALGQRERDALPAFTASAGFATAQKGDTIDDLVRRADDALYEAKRQGRNRVVG